MEIDIQDLAALFLIALLFVWILAAPWRRKKEDKLHWENWNKALNLSESEFGCRMFRIVGIHQQASTGTKAYAVFEDSSHAEAVWIPDFWPAKGEYIVSRGDYGYGSHHDEQQNDHRSPG